MSLTILFARLGLIASAIAFVAPLAMAEDASGVLKRASRAMGEPKTLRYVTEGVGYTFGQAFTPGMAWPKITVHSQIRTLNFDTAAMREEITLSRAEPQGGGGYPLSGQQRNDQFVHGNHAWNMAGTNPQPGSRFVNDRVHQLWITPHGVIKAAQRNNAKVQFKTLSGKPMAIVTFTEPGRFQATAYINENDLVERVESRLPDPVLGDVEAVANFSDYREQGGIQFPTRIQQSQGGHPTLDVNVKEVQANAPADIQVPEAVLKATERVSADKVADGVWFIAGGSHNSVAIEMKDHLVMVEAPLNDGRSGAAIEQIKQLAPGKPIRFMVNSHSHFDHSGGVRTAVAEGATIVTQAASQAFFEKILANQNRINPDRLAKSGKAAKVMPVGDKLDLSDGERTIELHRIQGSIHTNTFLMVYLPKEKLLIEADAFTPPPPNTPAPATPNANHVNLVDNIERLKLSVDRILPLHGRVVPLDDLYTAVGKKR